MAEEVKMTLRIPKELREKAKRKAKAEDTSVSRKIRQTLREWVGNDDPKKKD